MKHLITILLFLVSQNNFCYEYEAVVIVPVADAIGELLTKKNSNSSYFQLPVCTQPSCPRLHQLLFNERVRVTKRQGNFVCIHIPQLFYTTNTLTKPQNTYWTHKKNILSLAHHSHKQIIDHLPDPISFATKDMGAQKQTIVLTMPFHSSVVDMTFSAGTRFVLANQTDTAYHAYALNIHRKQYDIISIPKTNALHVNAMQTAADQKRQFVDILSQWAHVPDGFIPYVWGGCSFTAPYAGLFEKKCTQNCTQYHYLQTTQKIKGGFDCSGLIARAAQMCNIPYFYKNTTTIAKCLPPKNPASPLTSGDLIWVPGHIMVIANMEKNTIIEARSYDHGYGKVHEIRLGKVFENVKTFADLAAAYQTKKSLQRLDRWGKKRERFSEFSIFSLVQ